MKHEALRRHIAATLLSLAASFGALGCLITAFGLPVTSPGRLLASLTAFSLILPLLCRRKPTRLGALCALALTLGYLTRKAAFRASCFGIAAHILGTYESAYHFGMNLVPWALLPAGLPLGLLGVFIQWTVCAAVCTRRGSWLPKSILGTALACCLVVTDTVPGSLWLFLLLLTLFLLALTDTVRRDSTVQGTRLLLLGAIPAALALGLLFLLVPKESYVNRAPQLQEKLMTLAEQLPEKLQDAGISNVIPTLSAPQVDLAALGSQPKRGIPVLTMQAERSGTIYLRDQDYDRYTGTQWRATPTRREEFSGTGQPINNITLVTRAAQEHLLLTYYPLSGTRLLGGSVANPEGLKTYSFTQYEGGTAPFPSEHYLELPAATSTGLEPILSRLPGDFRTAASAAQSVGDYVRASARYDRDTASMAAGAEDFAIWFLEESETGYCTHFATAAVVLLRGMGVPARYVTGYRAEAAAGEAVTVTSDDAHAWAEYYDYGISAWCILDATPAEEPEVQEIPPTVESTEPEAVTTPRTTAPTQPPEKPAKAETTYPAASVLLTLGLLVLAVVLRRRFCLWLRGYRMSRRGPNGQALLYWRQVTVLARLQKGSVPEELETLAEKALYSQHELTAQELEAFRAYCRTSRRAIGAESKWRDLLGKYYYCVY